MMVLMCEVLHLTGLHLRTSSRFSSFFFFFFFPGSEISSCYLCWMTVSDRGSAFSN